MIGQLLRSPAVSIVAWTGVLVLLAALAWLVDRYRRTRRQNKALLKEKEVMFAFVHDVGEVFAETDIVEMESLLERVLFYALRTTRASAGVIYMLDGASEELRARAISGVCPPLVGTLDEAYGRAPSKSKHLEELIRTQRARRGAGLIGQVADFGAPILIEDAEMDPRVPTYEEPVLRIRSLMLVPMRFRHRVMGVMAVVNRTDGQSFVQSDIDLLQALADQASVSAYYALLREEIDAKRRLDHDLAVARRIQAMLLPRRIPEMAGAEVAAFNMPAQEIGGDYYDFIRVDDRHWGIAIADVSGKGVSGAIVMSVCRSVLHAKAPGCLSAAQVLRALNRVVSGDLAEDLFITMLYMVLDTDTMEVCLARAGHERPLRLVAAERRIERIESAGIAIGMGDPQAFDCALAETRVSLAPGDAVILYTDGITEAQNEAEEEWGVGRLEESILLAAGVSAVDTVARIEQRLVRFVGATAAYDDMTMVALKIRNAGTTN